MTSGVKAFITTAIIVIVAIALFKTSDAYLPVGGREESLKTNVINILDAKEYIDEKGVESVQYAYKTDAITPVENEIDRTQTGFTQYLGKDETGNDVYKLTSYSGVNFTEDVGVWKQVEYGTTTKVNYDSQFLPLGVRLFGEIAYADTIFGSAGDGAVQKGDSTVWDTTHDATDGSLLSVTGTTMSVLVQESSTYIINRVFAPINTATIPANATIVAATLNLYATSKTNEDNDGDDWLNIIQTSQASETTLVLADFDQAGAVNNPTEGATRIDIGSISTTAYNTWTFNSTGLTWIKKVGETGLCDHSSLSDPPEQTWTCLGVREGHDAIDSPEANETVNRVVFSASEASGTSQDPYLEVTYTVPATPATEPGRAIFNRGTTVFQGGTSVIQ